MVHEVPRADDGVRRPRARLGALMRSNERRSPTSRRSVHGRGTAAVVVGPRVFLRSPRPSDGPELTRANRRSARLHRGLARPPRTAAEFARYVARAAPPTAACFLVCRVEDGAIAGAIN